MTGKQDLRVVKTRRNIEETFVRLLLKTPFDQMTVRSIVAEALVNKGTFYRHYRDKYDLADHAFARVMEEARQSIRSRVSGMREGTPLAQIMGSLSSTLAEVLPKLLAFRGVPLERGSMEEQLEQLFSEEFARATEQWRTRGERSSGGESGPEIPDWALWSLASGFLRHCLDTGTTDDLRTYLEAVHRASGMYLDQLDRAES